MKSIMQLVMAVLAAILVFYRDKKSEAKEANDKIAKARADAARDFDARGGVPDETDPNLRD